jgi:small redox-active disulfide protein 2
VKIQILGTGCPKCKKLAELAERAAGELGINFEIEKVTGISEIIAFGVVSTPGLAVNGKVLAAGSLPSFEKVKELLASAQK